MITRGVAVAGEDRDPDARLHRVLAPTDPERAFQLAQDLVKAPGLDAAFGGLGVAVHGVAAPEHVLAVAPDGLRERRQAFLDAVGARRQLGGPSRRRAQRHGGNQPAHFIGGWAGAEGFRQPPMYFPKGGSTIRGTSKPGEIVWSRIYVANNAINMDIGRAGVVVAVNGDYTASNITNVPAGNIGSVTVQAAVNELDTEKAGLALANLFTAAQTIDLNAAALPAPLAGTVLHVGNADGVVTRIQLDGFAAIPVITGRRSNGTAAAPTARSAPG